jgi:hypothetical protein
MAADRGYFVRMAPPPGAAPTPAEAPSRAGLGNGPGPRPRRKRRRPIVKPIATLLAILAGGWLVWAQLDQESSANHELNRVITKARGMVVAASTDPTLKRAELYYNAQYKSTGAYPNLTDDQQHNGSDTDFGVGVTVDYCNEQAVVLQSMTGSGAVSRLLIHGSTIGDVLGTHDCPVDLSDPTPWSLKPPT